MVIKLKKIKLFLLLFLLPVQVLAYSDYIIPGGETLGIEINSNGVLVIGFYEINGKYNKGTPAIKSGDYIIAINGEKVDNVADLTRMMEDAVDEPYVTVTYVRGGKEKESKLELIKDNNIYKTGLYVKDSITGIGTLTYIDPATKVYGALGHEIIESNTKSIVEIRSGEIFRNYITDINRSSVGVAGSKNAKFFYDTKYGTINKNTNVGIYGIYNAKLPSKESIMVGTSDDITLGEASIYTVLEKEVVEEFKINITNIDKKSDIKNITFVIEDDGLLDKTGGVVQGMSGSPILQNGKIIGAVTHVIVDKPTMGYGLFITTMLSEGEKDIAN